tara:strand:+ start:11171 stop:11362 length:192 start_codon:yes stop_codon:yes gene_type:complete
MYEMAMQLNKKEMELLSWAFETLEDSIWSDDNRWFDIKECRNTSEQIKELKLKLRSIYDKTQS